MIIFVFINDFRVQRLSDLSEFPQQLVKELRLNSSLLCSEVRAFSVILPASVVLLDLQKHCECKQHSLMYT